MPNDASAAHHERLTKHLPRSLIQRLALLERGLLPTAAALFPTHKGKRLVSIYFALGAAVGGALGCAALLVLLASQAGFAHTHAALPHAPAVDPGERSAAPIELTVRGSERASMPFPLLVTGAEDAQKLRVTLRDLPEAAWLSSGERQDEHTWALRVADLDNLRLSLREGTPDAFDVNIEVASDVGAKVAATRAHVRLLDVAPQPSSLPQQAVLADIPMGARPVALRRAPEAVTTSAVAPVARPKPTLQAKAAASVPIADPANEPKPARREGANALGGPMAAEPAVDDRKVWWKMPAPAWSPFAEGGERR